MSLLRRAENQRRLTAFKVAHLDILLTSFWHLLSTTTLPDKLCTVQEMGRNAALIAGASDVALLAEAKAVRAYFRHMLSKRRVARTWLGEVMETGLAIWTTIGLGV